MKAICLALLSVVLLVGVAQAQGTISYSLAWAACKNLVLHQDNFSVDPAAGGTAVLWASGKISAPLAAGESVYGHRVDIKIGPIVPDGWRFDNDGCQPANGGEMAVSHAATATGCTRLSNGTVVPIDAMLYDPITGKGELTYSGAYPAGRIPVVGTNYALVRATFTLVGFADGLGCAGLEQPLCFHIWRGQYFIGPDPNNTREVEGDYSTGWVTWNDPTNTLGCPGPTAAQPSTWGKVKGLYR